MNDEARKQARAAYKGRAVVGGIFAVTNSVTGRRLIDATQSLASSRNRFDFAQSTGLALTPKLQKDWDAFGPQSFTFEVLEELERGETQTAREFVNDLKTLKELWLEKDHPAGLY